MIVNAIIETQQTRELWQMVGHIAHIKNQPTLKRAAMLCATYERRAASVLLDRRFETVVAADGVQS